MQAAPICYYFACVKHWISLGKAFIGLCLAHAPFLKYLMGPSIPHELNTMLCASDPQCFSNSAVGDWMIFLPY